MEEDSRLHIPCQERLEDIVHFVEDPGMINNVDCVGGRRKAGLQKDTIISFVSFTEINLFIVSIVWVP